MKESWEGDIADEIEEDVTPTVIGVENPLVTTIPKTTTATDPSSEVLDDSVGSIENEEAALTKLSSLYNR